MLASFRRAVGIATILKELKTFLQGRSVPAFLVGGYIRDSLVGIPTRDIDIAVQGDPFHPAKLVASAFSGSYVPLSQPHQVARVVVSSPHYGKWTVDLSGLKGPIDSDLARRDFTVNGMAIAVEDWCTPRWEDRVHDPFGGKEDLSRGVLRAIGISAFRDDPARLLRAVRLSARLGFLIEPGTEELIASEAHLVLSIAGERVRDEFLSILSLDRAKLHLETLDGLGLLCSIIPELTTTKGVQQPREHYWDVFGHSLEIVAGVERVLARRVDDRVSGAVPWGDEMEERFSEEVSDGYNRCTVLKLAALLHDIAKPQTKMVDADGRTRFLGHQTLGASMSAAILRRLHLSGRGVKMVHEMVESHLRPTQMSQNGELPTGRAVYRYFRDVGDVAIDTLYLNLADHLAARGPELDIVAWRRHAEVMGHILALGTRDAAPEALPRLITGHDLVETFGLTPGPRIGVILEGVREAMAIGEVYDRDSALAWAGERLDGSAQEDTGG